MSVNSTTCTHLDLQGATLHPHSTALPEAEESNLVLCRCSIHALLACAVRSCCAPEADAMNVLKCSAYLEVVFRPRWLLSRFRSVSFVVVRTDGNVHVGKTTLLGVTVITNPTHLRIHCCVDIGTNTKIMTLLTRGLEP